MLALLQAQKQKADSTKFGTAKFATTPSGTLSIWSWNINGVNAGLTKGTLQKFIKEADPDILCLNETKTDIAKIRS